MTSAQTAKLLLRVEDDGLDADRDGLGVDDGGRGLRVDGLLLVHGSRRAVATGS